MKVAIVILETLAIPCVYDAVEPSQNMFGGDFGSPSVSVHLPVPEGLDPETVMAVKDDQGNVTLVEDPSKVQAKLDAAWRDLRSQRNARLAATDYTQMPDSPLSSDKKAQWAEYRQALRDLPDVVQIAVPEDFVSVPWPQAP